MSDVLEWDIHVPLVSNVSVIVELLIALILFSAVLGTAVIYLTDISDIFIVFRFFLIIDGILIVLMLTIMGFVFTNRFRLLYRIDENGILTQIGDFEGKFNKLAWRITSFVQNHGFQSSRTSSMLNKKSFIPWDNLSHVVFNYKQLAATLIWERNQITRVYCYPDNVNLVFEILKRHLPKSEG
jgi:hypothetical protein